MKNFWNWNTKSLLFPQLQSSLMLCIQCPAYEYPNSERNHCLSPQGLDLPGLWWFSGDVTDLFISLLLCFLCSLLFISRPHTATCVLWQTTLGAVFTVAVATVLAKIATVILAFKDRKPGRTMGRLLVTGADVSFPCAPGSTWLSVESGWESLPLFLRWTLTMSPRSSSSCPTGLGHCLLSCPGLPGLLSPGDLVLGFPGQEPAWHLQWSQVPDLPHAGASQCLGHLPPRVCHSTKGKVTVAMENFSILASRAGLHLCPKVLHCSYKNWLKTLWKV